MLVKDKDILAEDPDKPKDGEEKKEPQKPAKPRISKEHMSEAWGDAFDYYLRGITEKYLMFRGRASRLEFWGFMTAAGIVWIPLYFLGEYIDMPLLPYYFLLATLLPTVAVTARRLHDVNKNAALYLIPGAVIAASSFFIGLYAAGLLLFIWAVLLVRMFSRETDLSEGFYGAPNENDEIYGDDNLPIIKKFRLLALMIFAVWLAVTGAKFDDWSRQAQQKAAFTTVMDRVFLKGKDAHLSPEQLKEAEQHMRGILKQMDGKTVSEKDLAEQIDKAVQAAAGLAKDAQNAPKAAPKP